MKTKSRQARRRFQLKILGYGNCYYIERINHLEAALARKPRVLQIDMVGIGEIPADAALRIRAALMGRSSKTRVITQAHSSLQGGSVLVWLMGDSRVIRDDARLFFRGTNLTEDNEAHPNEPWRNDEPKFRDSDSDLDAEEGDYARVLQVINEYLPVRELAGRFIGVPVLRQYGLVDHEQMDRFLNTAFTTKREPPNEAVTEAEEDCPRRKARVQRPRQIRK